MTTEMKQSNSIILDEMPHHYKANNPDSYNRLVVYAVSTESTVTLRPSERLVIVTPEKDAMKVLNSIDLWIAKENLDVVILPPPTIDMDNIPALVEDEATGADTLRSVIRHLLSEKKTIEEEYETALSESSEQLVAMTAARDSAIRDSDRYRKLWDEVDRKYLRAERQVKAISVLLNSVCK